MGARCASVLTLTPVPSGVVGCALLLLLSASFGCVNLNEPWGLAHPDGSAAGLSGVNSVAGTDTGGAGPGPISSGGVAGTSGAGGASVGMAIDAGTSMGGNMSSSASASIPRDAGGSTEIDAPGKADLPPATDGGVSDVATGGTGGKGEAGQTGGSGGTTTGFDAGADRISTGFDGRTGGTEAGGTGGIGGTTSRDGAPDQESGKVDAGVPDALLALDTSLPDRPCLLCAIGASLVHRYSFNGTGTTVTDSVGTAHGTVVNAQLSGSGTLVLTGGTSGQYVDLPDRILSTLTNATLEVWVTWNGGNNNQRILDFGDNEPVSSGSSRYRAVTTVIISPNSVPEQNQPPRLRASYSSAVSVGSTFVDSTTTLATGSIQHIVAVFDGQNQTLSMYLNGALVGQTTGLGALSQINDVNNWLGRSQYTDDPGFAGTYHEFRIYNAALTADQIQTLYSAGQNASFNQ